MWNEKNLTSLLVFGIIAAMYYWAMRDPKPKVRLYSFINDDGIIGISATNELEAVRYMSDVFSISETDVFLKYEIAEIPSKEWGKMIVRDTLNEYDEYSPDPVETTVAILMGPWIAPGGKKLPYQGPEMIYTTFE